MRVHERSSDGRREILRLVHRFVQVVDELHDGGDRSTSFARMVPSRHRGRQ